MLCIKVLWIGFVMQYINIISMFVCIWGHCIYWTFISIYHNASDNAVCNIYSLYKELFFSYTQGRSYQLSIQHLLLVLVCSIEFSNSDTHTLRCIFQYSLKIFICFQKYFWSLLATESLSGFTAQSGHCWNRKDCISTKTFTILKLSHSQYFLW